MFCPKCGNKTNDNANFCMKCGCSFAEYENDDNDKRRYYQTIEQKENKSNKELYGDYYRDSEKKELFDDRSIGIFVIMSFLPLINIIALFFGVGVFLTSKKYSKRGLMVITLSAFMIIFYFAVKSRNSAEKRAQEQLIQQAYESQKEVSNSKQEAYESISIPFNQLILESEEYSGKMVECAVFVDEVRYYDFSSKAVPNPMDNYYVGEGTISFEDEDEIGLIKSGDYVTICGVVGEKSSFLKIKDAHLINVGEESKARYNKELDDYWNWYDRKFSNRNSVIVNDIDTFEIDIAEDKNYTKILATEMINTYEMFLE